MQLIRQPARRARRAPRERTVLAITGDTQVGLWMLRSLALGRLTVYAVCNTPAGQAAHSRYCAGAWMIDRSPGAPPAERQIEELARRLDVGSVMPIAEGYHDALIRARQRFEPDIHLFSPPASAFVKATDKDFMQRLCVQLGVPVARGMTLAELMAAGGDGLRFPLVLRTRRQNVADESARAPWKAAYALDRSQLGKLHEQVAAAAENVIVQEYHPGAEDHVQVLVHRGEAFAAGEYIGEHHMPLAGGVTVQRVSCRHTPVIRDAGRLLAAVGWDGIAGVQFHYDPATGKYIFLEINPRFIGGLPTIIMAGFHAPFLLWQSRFEPERMRRPAYQLGLRTRILGGDANWLLGMIRGDALPPGQRRLSKLGATGRFLFNCGPWTRDDSFCLGDAKPFLVDLRQMVRRLGGETFDILGHSQTERGEVRGSASEANAPRTSKQRLSVPPVTEASRGVFITFDVECSMGGAWDNPSLQPVPPERAVWGDFAGRRLGLPLICDILGRWDLRATFFVDAFMAEQGYPDGLEPICRFLLDRGQDVQLHIHPNHKDFASAVRGVTRPRTDQMADLSPQEQRALLEEGADRLQRCTGRRPVAFRAGNMGASEETLVQLAAAGMRLDSSYAFPYAGGQCRFAPREPYNGSRWYGGVLELALSGFRQPRVPGLRPAKPLDLVGISFPECRDAIRLIAAAGADAVLILHSFSLFKVRNVQYDGGRPNRIVEARFQRFCRWLGEGGHGLTVRTFADVDRAVQAGEYAPKAVPPCKLVRPLRALTRMAVQAVNRVYWV